MSRACVIHTLGKIEYTKCLALQRQLVQHLRFLERAQTAMSASTASKDLLLFAEHDPVFTLGRRPDMRHVLFDVQHPPAGHAVHQVERGGEVTFHGPGQIMCYPILRLKYHRQDLRWYVRSLEEVVIRTLRRHGIRGQRDDINSGVFVGPDKIAALGVAVKQWITFHGICLNVCPDMDSFAHIVPCGLADRGVTSVHAHASSRPSAEQLRADLCEEFAEVFDVRMVRDPAR